MLAPAGITPTQVDQLELWQVGVLIHADHPNAANTRQTGKERLVAEALARNQRKQDTKPPAAPQPAAQPTFGFVGIESERTAASMGD